MRLAGFRTSPNKNLEQNQAPSRALKCTLLRSDYSVMILFRQDFRLVMEKLMEKRSSEPCSELLRARDTFLGPILWARDTSSQALLAHTKPNFWLYF